MGRRLIVHQPNNHYSRRYRYYNIFFDNLITRLSEKNEVVVDRYYKNVHRGRVNVDLCWEEPEEFLIEMQDCEMIIEDYDTKETFVFSVSDDLTPTSLNLQSYENTKKVFVSQFIRPKVDHHVHKEYRHKYSPWIYFPSNQFDLDAFYEKRKGIVDKQDKMYFRGETTTRTILKYFKPEFFHGGNSIGGFNAYANDLINFKIGLSIAGRGEMCYRDVEYMAMGIPFLRFEYTTEFAEPLIPNYHYISVERPDDLKDWMNLDRNGLEHHAEMIMERFIQVKEDHEFLKFVTDNARKYYENYLSPTSSVDFTLKLCGYDF